MDIFKAKTGSVPVYEISKEKFARRVIIPFSLLVCTE